MFYSFIFISRVTSRFSCRYTWWVLYISFSWDFRACPSRPAALLAHVQSTTSLILYVNRAGFFWVIELIRKCRLSPSVWSVFFCRLQFDLKLGLQVKFWIISEWAKWHYVCSQLCSWMFLKGAPINNSCCFRACVWAFDYGTWKQNWAALLECFKLSCRYICMNDTWYTTE